jgi:hypothetical protein
MSFLAKKIAERESFIYQNSTPDEQKELLNDLLVTASAMHAAGVSSEDDYKDFFYISSQVNNIVRDFTGSYIDDENLAKLSHYIYKNRENQPINTIINFYKAVKNALDNCQITITKKAYPVEIDHNYIQSPHNITKWVDAMRQIYAYNQRGCELGKAFEIVTNKWEKMEKNDFNHWLSFYQSGGHISYKTAQQKYYMSGEDSGQIPFAALQNIDALRAGLRNQQDSQNAEDAKLRMHEEKKSQEKEEISEKMTKLVGRLNSAEKIFTSADFKKVLGDDYNEWLECLHKLKRIIYSKQPKSASIIYDIMVRHSNELKNSGFKKAARFMNILAAYQINIVNQFDDVVGLPISKYAQTPPPPLGGDIADPTMSESTDLLGGSGDVTSEDGRDLSDPEGAMKEFIENLGGEESENDKRKDASFEEDGAIITIAEDGFYKLAQISPPAPVSTPAPAPAPAPAPTSKPVPKPLTEPKMETEKVEEVVEEVEGGDADIGDNAIDAALKNIRLPDVIAKLEELVQFYRNRQISRELLIVDLMLEALNISAFFPSMAEASKSSLDSNQYVLTRLEEILAKLRGAAAAEDGSMNTIKEKLEQQVENSDKKREDKEKADMVPTPGLEALPTEERGPSPEPEKELAAPATVERTPQPAPVR